MGNGGGVGDKKERGRPGGRGSTGHTASGANSLSFPQKNTGPATKDGVPPVTGTLPPPNTHFPFSSTSILSHQDTEYERSAKQEEKRGEQRGALRN